ncbi:helix-turn-helix domain-containing protein [Caldimonas brevitalea]|uniref:Transcriptional regulator n=1 Tax=Caldimonas brevitalea TaxID=413882 RepID=A0A0G3BVC6_9BURK|nr:helix-turn-helix transcriptional regulator [Caldimonas brevitalea]AKJ31983.1 transcriptional regulator [Caldimonas brevitalea]
MIRFKLAELIAQKQFVEGRRITVQEVAAGAGLNRVTLSKMLNHRGHVTGTDVVDKLCAYFQCSVGELMEYVPDEQKGPAAP